MVTSEKTMMEMENIKQITKFLSRLLRSDATAIENVEAFMQIQYNEVRNWNLLIVVQKGIQEVA